MTQYNLYKNLKLSDSAFWDDRYESGQTGWDIGYASTPVKEYADQISDKEIKILIPGCGNAYEAEYLLQSGFRDITVLDISEVLTEKLKMKFGGYEGIRIFNEDFFEHEDKYDLIIEQTFFCALDPGMREEYAVKMSSLLSENGKVAGVLFDTQFEKEGPPFGGSRNEYEVLFGKHFEIKTLERCYNSVAKRSGNEVFINLKNKKL
ncbi:MAG TPA: SAM-dependent methyltransferase [Ignavibacteria bacterium]|nr:SAM-dependent methyltransferase [Ignavibacteria bacterium]HRJ99372.1 SAM-dependent methyltransferase [Ignavibacteria bacterium]